MHPPQASQCRKDLSGVIQAAEEQHVRSRLDGDSTFGSDSGSSISDSDASAGSSDAELDPDLGADLDQRVDNAVLHAANQQHMNSSLLNMYSTPSATLPSEPSASDLVNQAASASQAADATGIPAFAPPQARSAPAALPSSTGRPVTACCTLHALYFLTTVLRPGLKQARHLVCPTVDCLTATTSTVPPPASQYCCG